jgi:hypothetical protein
MRRPLYDKLLTGAGGEASPGRNRPVSAKSHLPYSPLLVQFRLAGPPRRLGSDRRRGYGGRGFKRAVATVYFRRAAGCLGWS